MGYAESKTPKPKDKPRRYRVIVENARVLEKRLEELTDDERPVLVSSCINPSGEILVTVIVERVPEPPEPPEPEPPEPEPPEPEPPEPE